MNMAQVMAEAFKALGIAPGQARLIQGVSASNIRRKSRSAPTRPCPFGVTVPDSAAGYSLREVTALDFQPMPANDVNDQGQVVGTVSMPGAPPNIPWIWQQGIIDRLTYAGRALRVSNRGQVAAMLQCGAAE